MEGAFSSGSRPSARSFSESNIRIAFLSGRFFAFDLSLNPKNALQTLVFVFIVFIFVFYVLPSASLRCNSQKGLSYHSEIGEACVFWFAPTLDRKMDQSAGANKN